MVDRAARSPSERLTVFYEGACPICVRDRRTYEKLAGERDDVCWVDITGAEARLREAGIDPRKALTELHVQDGEGNIFSEIDAYRLLMARIPLLKPLGWLIGLPLVRPILSKLYRWWVRRRLIRDGRL